MTAIEKHTGRRSATKPPIGLLLSIGAEKPSRGPGRPIDYIRPKEGQLDQYAGAAAKFTEVYGPEPKQLDDVYFLSNNIGDVLNIRLMAWGESGPRIVGDTNFATLPPDEWEDRAFAFDDEITYFPLSPADVKSDIRATWNGEPIRGRLSGPDDARIDRLKINIECTLNFCLPKIMGFGTVAQITTKGRRSTRNLMSAIHDQNTFFQGQLIGIPFRLTSRPARARHFDKESRRYMMTTFPELVLDTPFTVQEAIDLIRERREALGPAQPMLDSPESAAFTRALALPVATEETTRLREEPAAESLPDALLNRIAHLEGQVGEAGAHAVLKGVFGVESATELAPGDAERYEAMLERNLEAEDVTDAEIVAEEQPSFEELAAAAQAKRDEREQAS